MPLDQPLNSLGFAKPPAETRVVVAMSGGVDSSVVAAQLAEEGYDVVGVTLQLYDHGAALAKKGACCAGRDIHDARRVAETMGFPHYVLDYENMFREAVIDEFADAYLAGATPVPCIRCNERVKFKDLLGTAKDLDADCMATGHYIQRKTGLAGAGTAPGGRSQPATRAISCFRPRQSSWRYLRFPLGHLASKAETRALAARYGLAVADKPDSQDICFVPNGDYAAVIEKLRPGAADPGEIVDARRARFWAGIAGVIHYTVGQRRGLGIGGLDEPLYVVRLDPDARRVIVGPKEALSTRIVPVREINWLGDGPLGQTGGMACFRQGPVHPATARGDPAAASADRGRGGTAEPRGRCLARAGLRLLRNRRQPGLGRRLDLARPLNRGPPSPATLGGKGTAFDACGGRCPPGRPVGAGVRAPIPRARRGQAEGTACPCPPPAWASTERAARRPGASPPRPSRSIVRRIASIWAVRRGPSRRMSRSAERSAAARQCGPEKLRHRTGLGHEVDQRHRIDARHPPASATSSPGACRRRSPWATPFAASSSETVPDAASAASAAAKAARVFAPASLRRSPGATGQSAPRARPIRRDRPQPSARPPGRRDGSRAPCASTVAPTRARAARPRPGAIRGAPATGAPRRSRPARGTPPPRPRCATRLGHDRMADEIAGHARRRSYRAARTARAPEHGRRSAPPSRRPPRSPCPDRGRDIVDDPQIGRCRLHPPATRSAKSGLSMVTSASGRRQHGPRRSSGACGGAERG